ncbi:MAG: ABC1 kinase family protein [Bacteriovoracia bacterium]
MQLFKTGHQVTQAVKNVQRLRTILATFGRHGLDEFIVRLGLERQTNETKEGIEHLSIPERLRSAFEELGPAFVKFGQLLSNRPDMIPESYIEEFKKLQDDVAPLPFSVIKKQVESQLGGEISKFFSFFKETPIASASIGQVHEAKLITGEEVVVKVQRPDIEKTIKNDISILTFLAGLMEKYIPETRIISPVTVVDEFFKALTFELDYVIEANNTTRIGENLKVFPNIIVPKVYKKLSTHRILTLQKINGIRITELKELEKAGINPTELVDLGVRAFFKMVMQDGLFHGDLHGGNLFALKDPSTGQAQIGVIDFGMVGRLSQKSRDTFAKIVLALLIEDYETICYEYAELSSVSSGVDFDAFQRDIRNTLSPYMGLPLKDLNFGAVLIESTKIAVKYNIKIPGDWMIVFKAIFTIEGMGRQLDPDFDFLAVGNELVKDVIKDRYSMERISKDLAWTLRDLSETAQVLPRQIRWMFKKFNSNDFAFEIKIKEIEIVRNQIEKGFRGLGLSILASSMIIAAALSTQMKSENTIHLWGEIPIPSFILFVLGFLGFLRLMSGRFWK